MILKWINQMNRGAEAQAAGQGDEADGRKRRDSKLVDVAHEALAERAARDRDTLDALVKLGWPAVQRERFKGKVRKKVWQAVSDESGAADVDMIEEVTERIVDAAEADPYYRRMFGGEEG